MGKNFRSAGRPVTTFRFGEFTFDCGSRQLWCRGVERHLTPRAQHLLQLLLLARPRVLSREELYDAIWPSTFVCETNLACVVNELRRALEDDARTAQYIRTVHGFGYAFAGAVVASTATVVEVAVLLCEGRHHSLHQGENVIGRAADLRIIIADRGVSRRHAAILVDGDSISIQDLGSLNGTYVDEQRIGRSPVLLPPGAQIRFGVIAASIMRRSNSSTRRLQAAQLTR